MSAGDIDDRLAPEGDLEQLRFEFPALNDYLSWAWAQIPIIRTFFIPFGAGISTDLRRVYVSYDIQTIVNGVECVSALVRHETTEAALREYCDIGTDYKTDPRGHRLGNRAEFDRVNDLLAVEDGWEIYSEIIDPQVLNSEREDLKDKPIPRDLAMYPYEEAMVDKLQDAMWNLRSVKEWKRLHGDNG